MDYGTTIQFSRTEDYLNPIVEGEALETELGISKACSYLYDDPSDNNKSLINIKWVT